MSRRGDAYERHLPDAYRFAHHLSGDAETARRSTLTAFARCFGRLEHLRSDDIFELSLLREVWRASVPRMHRRSQAEHATHILSGLGLDAAAVAEILPRPGDEAWTALAPSDELPYIEVIPDRAGLYRAIRGGRYRLLAGVLSLVAFVGAAVATPLLIDGGPARPPSLSTPGLPDVLPESYEATGPRVTVVQGRLGNDPWIVNAYKARHRSVCIELRVEDSYGDVHCPSQLKIPLRGFVGSDALHQTTFLYGYVRADVTDINVRVKGSAAVGVEIGRNPERLGFRQPGGFFAVTVSGYLLPLTTRDQGERLGYRVFKLKLTARDENGRRVGTQTLLLGRP